MTGYILVAGM